MSNPNCRAGCGYLCRCDVLQIPERVLVSYEVIKLIESNIKALKVLSTVLKKEGLKSFEIADALVESNQAFIDKHGLPPL